MPLKIPRQTRTFSPIGELTFPDEGATAPCSSLAPPLGKDEYHAASILCAPLLIQRDHCAFPSLSVGLGDDIWAKVIQWAGLMLGNERQEIEKIAK